MKDKMIHFFKGPWGLGLLGLILGAGIGYLLKGKGKPVSWVKLLISATVGAASGFIGGYFWKKHSDQEANHAAVAAADTHHPVHPHHSKHKH